MRVYGRCSFIVHLLSLSKLFGYEIIAYSSASENKFTLTIYARKSLKVYGVPRAGFRAIRALSQSNYEAQN